MKLLVIGAGSIGQRHLRNTLQLGGVECAVVEPDQKQREAVAAACSVPVFEDLDEGIAWRPQAAMVCTPSHAHLEPSLRCASEGIHLFIEKPISHSMDGLDELKRLVEKNNLICLVGYNLRFHPGLQAVKRVLDEGRLGSLWFAEIEYGHYLPFWRPDQDYRKTYSAHRDMGGGAILDLIHELDYAQWFFVKGTPISAVGGKRSGLELDCEDLCVAMVEYERPSGMPVRFHLDYLQRRYVRYCKVVGEHGVVLWDMPAGFTRLYLPTAKNTPEALDGTVLSDFTDFDFNTCYIHELEYYLRAVENGERLPLSLGEAIETLSLALAIREKMHPLQSSV